MKTLFDTNATAISHITTKAYSTSFSMGARLLSKPVREAIYGIYGFVRFADEIVDTFHDHDQNALLQKFERDTYEAIAQGISLNPILHSFQRVVNTYGIERELIDTFLSSMRMDLERQVHNQSTYEKYILGSAEVVGLMCLRVFVHGDEQKFRRLQAPAMRLGAAFQKINFLRDLHADYVQLGRSYFPNADLSQFDDQQKQRIEAEIEDDFAAGLAGIVQLPASCKFGVYVAYAYFYRLFLKIKRTRAEQVMHTRIRIPNPTKVMLIVEAYFKHRFQVI